MYFVEYSFRQIAKDCNKNAVFTSLILRMIGNSAELILYNHARIGLSTHALSPIKSCSKATKSALLTRILNRLYNRYRARVSHYALPLFVLRAQAQYLCPYISFHQHEVAGKH